MRKLAILLTLMFTSLIGIAQSYKKILSKYDVIALLPEQSDGDAKSFWTYILDNNIDFMSSVEKLFKKKGSAIEAREEMFIDHSKNYIFLKNDETFYTQLDSLKYLILGCYSMAKQSTIYYLNYNEVNAFCAHKIEGSYINIYLCKGLLNALPKDPQIRQSYLCAVLAHEFTHGLFLHALFHLYKTKKKEKTNNLLADIATGMAAFHDNYSKARGTESMIEDLGDFSRDVHYNAERSTLLYQFKYGREQELQADIVAFRLLDWLGIGGENVIRFLNAIKEPYEYSDEYSDHPTIQERVNLLEYISKQRRVIPTSK